MERGVTSNTKTVPQQEEEITHCSDGCSNAAYSQHPQQMSCFFWIVHGFGDFFSDETAYISQKRRGLVGFLSPETEH